MSQEGSSSCTYLQLLQELWPRLAREGSFMIKFVMLRGRLYRLFGLARRNYLVPRLAGTQPL